MEAVFFDNAKNHVNAAKASAMARVRRELLSEGAAYYVEWVNKSGVKMFWNGSRYDVLGLARDLVFNGVAAVMLDPAGRSVDVAAASY